METGSESNYFRNCVEIFIDGRAVDRPGYFFWLFCLLSVVGVSFGVAS